ncbi:autophagy-related protein 23, putative [Plasmodium chabaudi adami]|uniref:Autophagy-related protein 23, putative n=1 Tax=Plasmodium chabaudi adami TaxID=5826 RepID=A0A1D3RWL3_PLACE|nr:autophagy-related protein 23, putative [Plasmodium chabaudi adami]
MIRGTQNIQIKKPIGNELLMGIKKMENELKKRNEEFEELSNNYREIYGLYVMTKKNLDESSNNFQGEVCKLESVIKGKDNEYMNLKANFQEVLEEKNKLEEDIDEYEKAIYEINENLASLKEAHMEELKEIQEEISNLYLEIEKSKDQLDTMQEECEDLRKLNHDKSNTIDSLSKEIEALKEEKKQREDEMELIISYQNKVKMEMEYMNNEKDKLKEDENKFLMEKKHFEIYKQQLEDEKKKIEQKNEELGKEKDRQENNMKNIIIKYTNLQKKVDDLSEDNSNKDTCIKENQNKINLLNDENNVLKNEVTTLNSKMQELKNELDSEQKKNTELMENVDNKTNEVSQRDSIIQILYSKLKEQENENLMFQNENISLKNHSKKLNTILENRKKEMDHIENGLCDKLTKSIIKRKIRDKDDLCFEGHPQSMLLKILWDGYVDICKNVLRSRDTYLFTQNRNHKFICVYDTDLFLDITQESKNKCSISYKSETRGIFFVNDDENKNMIYVGPFSKYSGYNVSACKKSNNLELTSKAKNSYIFEEMCTTKKGTKLILIKEKESGKYFGGLHNNFYFEKQKQKQNGVDKSYYNDAVNKLIDYMSNDKEENASMVLKKCNSEVKIEEGSEHAEQVEKVEQAENVDEGEKAEEGEKADGTNEMNDESKESDNKIEDENVHKYNIAKDMLLLSNSNCNSTTDNDSNGYFEINNKFGCQEGCKNDEEFDENNSSLKKYIGNNNLYNYTNISMHKCYIADTPCFNNTILTLTENKDEAILFEVFNYEQIVEHDSIKYASECILQFLLNFKKTSSQDLSTVCSNKNSNFISLNDEDWNILPAYM